MYVRICVVHFVHNVSFMTYRLGKCKIVGNFVHGQEEGVRGPCPDAVCGKCCVSVSVSVVSEWSVSVECACVHVYLSIPRRGRG